MQTCTGEPFAVHTSLGWVINGPIDPFKSIIKTSHFVRNVSALIRDLRKLWELEGVNSEVPGMSQSDLKTLETLDNGKKYKIITHCLFHSRPKDLACLMTAVWQKGSYRYLVYG